MFETSQSGVSKFTGQESRLWGHRVVPRPYNPKIVYITTFGGSVWYGPASGDPNAAEDIAGPPLLRYSKD